MRGALAAIALLAALCSLSVASPSLSCRCSPLDSTSDNVVVQFQSDVESYYWVGVLRSGDVCPNLAGYLVRPLALVLVLTSLTPRSGFWPRSLAPCRNLIGVDSQDIGHTTEGGNSLRILKEAPDDSEVSATSLGTATTSYECILYSSPVVVTPGELSACTVSTVVAREPLTCAATLPPLKTSSKNILIGAAIGVPLSIALFIWLVRSLSLCHCAMLYICCYFTQCLQVRVIYVNSKNRKFIEEYRATDPETMAATTTALTPLDSDSDSDSPVVSATYAPMVAPAPHADDLQPVFVASYYVPSDAPQRL